MRPSSRNSYSFEPIEALILAVLGVWWWPAPGLRRDLEERVGPAGLLTGALVRHELAQDPQQLYNRRSCIAEFLKTVRPTRPT